MVRLERPTQEEFDRWFALSVERQAQDRAWVQGSAVDDERARLDAMVPILLPDGMESPNHSFRIARGENGRELGFVWVGVLPDSPKETCVLFDIYVHEECRGHGVAHAMLEATLEAVRAYGTREVQLFVRADNAPARALYADLGFVEIDATAGARDVRMRKELEPDPSVARMQEMTVQHVAVEDLPSAGWILDLGGGGEGMIGRLAGERVVAIDRRRDELEEAPPGPLKITMDARELGFLDGSFSTVTAFFTFLYISGEDHRRVFEEAFRILSPGGRFLIWDAILPPRDDEGKDIVVVPVRVVLPTGKAVSTRYGARWPAEGRDVAHYRVLAGEAGFAVLAERVVGSHFALQLGRP
ncbi:MAG: bifunctional GNAT family N-acetyltransferase/class I SAM-dependent methyltransferase [Candidatus Bipolaricaulota bacterium]